MAIPVIHMRHAFGFRENVATSVAFTEEQTVAYPCGSNIVLYNIDQKTQKFVPGYEKSQGMTCMAMSPNRRYIAVADKAENPVIHIYDISTSKRKKTLTAGESPTGEFISIAFSPDSKYVVAQSGQPDWMMYYWSWEKNRLLAQVKSTTSHSQSASANAVTQISFNPHDSTQICVVGHSGLFKMFRYAENNLKQYLHSKPDTQNYLCHAWASEDKVVVGTNIGRWIIFEGGEQRAEGNIKTLVAETLTADNGGATEFDIEQYSEITACAASTKGIAIACGPGMVHWLERTEEREHYKRVRLIRIPPDQNSADPSRSESQSIMNMTISPSEETLVVSTDCNQLYYTSLSSTEMGKMGDTSNFDLLAQSFHWGQVVGLDVCIRKPLIATASVDRSVRIWNFETSALELYKEFAEEAYSIALHPSGLYILVGFSDKLRLMNILIDDIRTFKELPVRGCRECAFSNGGHFFAAVHGNVIQLYSTTTFENFANLKGHNGKIKNVLWSTDDTKLISCGMDGAVYEWDPMTGKRLGESVLKACSYTGVTVTPDGKTSFAVGSDKKLKEISDSQILREIESEDATMTSVVLANNGRMLFAGTNTGTVRAMKFPLTQPGEWHEHLGHCGQINKMRITMNDEFLITVSDDRTILIWKITDKEGRGLKRDKELGYAEEILITKSDLEEKNSMMHELKTRVEELKMENEYQLRLKDMNYNEKIKELTEKFIQEMESLKTKNQVLKTEKDKEESKHEEQLQEVMEKHSKELQDLEAANNQKLMLEYEKYQELQVKSQQMQEEYERQLSEMERKHEETVTTINGNYEEKIYNLRTNLDEERKKRHTKETEHEETKRLIEEDADREILDTKIKYERKLRDEREQNARLKGESGIMRKKFTSLQKEIDDHKEEIKKYQLETTKLNNVIKNLDKDILGLKKEIQERDETIQDKEKRIYDLKKKNQELEKFKFVLDYKIKELKKQIEPRENDIKNYKEQIQEMESELERFHKQNTQLELNITELKQKQLALEQEMKNERQAKRDTEAILKRYKTDLHNCVGYIQEPKMLKECVVALYKKHVQEDIRSEAGTDADIQKEFNRQREHLERSVMNLRKKLVKDTEMHRADYVRIMQENVSLIKEINDLRRELKVARTSISDLEAALGLNRKHNEQAKQLVHLITTTKANPMLEKDYEESRRVIDSQLIALQQLRRSSADQIPSPKEEPILPPISNSAHS